MPHGAVFQQSGTFDELLKIPLNQIGEIGIARMNLLCASGLPEAEKMNLSECLKTLDRYAEAVRVETEKYFPMYVREPGKYKNSEGYFKMLVLVTVLKKNLGIDYNSGRSNHEAMEAFFADSKDIFLNGLLAPPYTGTCASLPVLVVAVCQKLGYPVQLVPTHNHLFARWEDSKDRFNIECTNGGLSTHPDEYYTQGPFAWSGSSYDGEHFLQSIDFQRSACNIPRPTWPLPEISPSV